MTPQGYGDSADDLLHRLHQYEQEVHKLNEILNDTEVSHARSLANVTEVKDEFERGWLEATESLQKVNANVEELQNVSFLPVGQDLGFDILNISLIRPSRDWSGRLCC